MRWCAVCYIRFVYLSTEIIVLQDHEDIVLRNLSSGSVLGSQVYCERYAKCTEYGIRVFIIICLSSNSYRMCKDSRLVMFHFLLNCTGLAIHVIQALIKIYLLIVDCLGFSLYVIMYCRWLALQDEQSCSVHFSHCLLSTSTSSLVIQVCTCTSACSHCYSYVHRNNHFIFTKKSLISFYRFMYSSYIPFII